MKLSVFPKAKALPDSGEEKNKEAKYTSRPHLPEVREFDTEDDLIDLITSYAWSPFIFNGYRRDENFVSTDLLVFDIDDEMTIEEAEEVIQELKVTCLCLPTTSHTEDHHKFRLIFPLAKTITDPDIFKATYHKYAQYFPVDPACKDTARFYFGSTDDDGFFYDYDLLEPSTRKLKKASQRGYDRRDVVEVGQNIEELIIELYGEPRDKVPEPIAYFLENAPEPDRLAGQWFHSSNSFLFTCGLLNLEQERIERVFFSLYPYEELTEKKVAKMIEDGYNAREEEE